MLAWLGYAPGRGNGDTLALALTYAAVPSALKLAAGLIVLLAPLPESVSRDPSPPGKGSRMTPSPPCPPSRACSPRSACRVAAALPGCAAVDPQALRRPEAAHWT
jgi:hypothetical protein